MEKIKITQEGLDKVNQELDNLVKNERPRIINRIKEARELGDLSENFDYHDAKREQGVVESRIAELKYIIENAELTEAAGTDKVQIGSRVKIFLESMGMENEFTIVGPAESDIAAGKISCDSPMGEALLGAGTGDDIEFNTPGGLQKCKVLAIN